MDREPCCRSSALVCPSALAMGTGESGQSSPQLPNYICAVSQLLILALTDLSLGTLITEINDIFDSLHSVHKKINQSS